MRGKANKRGRKGGYYFWRAAHLLHSEIESKAHQLNRRPQIKTRNHGVEPFHLAATIREPPPISEYNK